MTIMDRQSELLPAARIEAANVLLTQVCDQLDRILLGRSALHRQVMIGILSRGHILLEGLPGLGKTALVKALGDILQLDFKRIQFTPDLMPGDILGTHILQQRQDGEREMAFTPGPVFTNLLLADEINRASPKTQSAMLETMQEHRVTLLGTTRPLPDPFFVLASQNPIELEGTYPLPEAQLDRFLFKLVVRDIDAEVLAAIITSRRHGTPPPPTVRLSAAELQTLFATVDAILLPAAVARYIGRLVAATHPQADDARPVVRDYVNYGASPRAAIAIAEAARGAALFGGRPTVGFDDVKLVAPAVLNHRLILNYKARFDGVDTFRVIDELLTAVDAAGMDLPSSVSVTGVPPT
jgi:MoxR-like ATPase